jgi:hypothetical protein
VRCDSGGACWCAMRCPQTTTASKRHCSIVLWSCSRSSDSVARRSASLADIGLISSIPTPIPTPTPIGVPNESAGDTQAKNLYSLFLHHHLRTLRGLLIVASTPVSSRRGLPVDAEFCLDLIDPNQGPAGATYSRSAISCAQDSGLISAFGKLPAERVASAVTSGGSSSSQ